MPKKLLILLFVCAIIPAAIIFLAPPSQLEEINRDIADVEQQVETLETEVKRRQRLGLAPFEEERRFSEVDRVAHEAYEQEMAALERQDHTIASESPNAFSVMAWNVESDGNDPELIAQQLSSYTDDIICLSEVHPKSVDRYKGIFPDRTAFVSRSGRSDRLMILTTDRFEVLEQIEHDDINDGRHRSPLSVRLRDTKTDKIFLVMTVHLARGDADFRTEQTSRIVEWARNESHPIIAIGDFNMDLDFRTAKGNEAFATIMRDGVFYWLDPKPLIDTNWSDDGNGNDRYPDSMLDFAFAANGAQEWRIESTVVVTDGDFPDDERTSDHRPIRLVVESQEGIDESD